MSIIVYIHIRSDIRLQKHYTRKWAFRFDLISPFSYMCIYSIYRLLTYSCSYFFLFGEKVKVKNRCPLHLFREWAETLKYCYPRAQRAVLHVPKILLNVKNKPIYLCIRGLLQQIILIIILYYNIRAHTHTHTHTHTHVGFYGLRGLSIGVMVFILYKLYVLLPYTYPTPKLSPHRRRCISTFPQKKLTLYDL